MLTTKIRSESTSFAGQLRYPSWPLGLSAYWGSGCAAPGCSWHPALDGDSDDSEPSVAIGARWKIQVLVNSPAPCDRKYRALPIESIPSASPKVIPIPDGVDIGDKVPSFATLNGSMPSLMNPLPDIA